MDNVFNGLTGDLGERDIEKVARKVLKKKNISKKI